MYQINTLVKSQKSLEVLKSEYVLMNTNTFCEMVIENNLADTEFKTLLGYIECDLKPLTWK